MGATTDLATLADFFGRYGCALAAGDLPAIAGCYAMPGMVVSDAYSFTFSSPAAVALSFVGALPAYQERGVVAAHAEIEDVTRLDGTLVLVAVRWEYLDCAGEAVPGERFRYLVRLGQPSPQICVVMPVS
ncbi:MAG TPA: hypothetical protein VFR67_30505 [Pilimelia sp.]|nr:hypothetical protein [Pilimelia sp.]